ncbi:hypothetical protein ABIC28_004878 [Rhodococcus sp. PvR044]|jgi:hypothetical protein|uniref:DUF4126 domain-containing protein n=1 Tax=Rhodococcus TaxID=1827 RepID=UPI000BD8D2FA|nr:MULTISPECIES: DUF4126 domain-containing protein [unclassified Rhodococcus (in: high G+C Gram-positive bacteria)]PTR36949.1 uncharacterized protein DUF4126 [Rhodococcus sp. OK611]SNX93680.1 protein of unknown function [Rhodococcus sp. OK270]
METWLLPALLGLGLAAATGLRTFLPLLMLSAAAHFELFGISLGESFAWVGSTGALVALAAATAAELLADLIPLVDNALGMFGTISRPIAAAIAAGAVFTDLDPSTAVIAGIIVGAPTALAFSAAQTGTRAVSTATTGGLANPALSVIEDGVSFGMVLVAFLLPLLIPLVLGLMLWFAWKGARRVRALRS